MTDSPAIIGYRLTVGRGPDAYKIAICAKCWPHTLTKKAWEDTWHFPTDLNGPRATLTTITPAQAGMYHCAAWCLGEAIV